LDGVGRFSPFIWPVTFHIPTPVKATRVRLGSPKVSHSPHCYGDYGPEYLRKPTMTDIEKLYRHHEEKHGFPEIRCVASQDLWISHAFFGVAGLNNDINVLYQSSLFNNIKTGRALEIPFVANGITYRSGYYLVDGIYSELAPLIKTIPEPADDNHKRILYKQKQESSRKDVERAFGVLKKKLAILANPTRALKKDRIINIWLSILDRR
nr:hypothetical protein [Tanacetum cinerariifolium]